MINKQGITVTVMVITVIILIILAGTITFSVSSTINYSILSTWASEITNIQDIVDEQLGLSSSMNFTSGNITIDISNATLRDEQFAGENIVNNTIEVKVIDLAKLNITNTKYGNLETSMDMYAISEETGRVYYVQGVEVDEEVYYTLTINLKNRFKLNSTERNLSSVVFVPSSIGYTNEPITLKVKIPSTYTNIVITTSNNDIQVGSQTLKGNVYEYNINANKVTGNYKVTVSYNDGTQALISTYNVNGYDDVPPVINPIAYENIVYKETENKKTEYLTNIIAIDESGIKVLKYAVGTITQEQAKEYFEENANTINDGKINLDGNTTTYTIYAEDNAGNFSVLTFDKKNIMPEDWKDSVTYIQDRVPIPKGFVASHYEGENKKNQGLVIYELTSEEQKKGITTLPEESHYTSQTTRNQYVWIPVNDFNNFVRQNFFNEDLNTNISNALGTENKYWEVVVNKETNMPLGALQEQNTTYMSEKNLLEVQAMYQSVKEYKGFYVARYEAGVDEKRRIGQELITGENVHTKMNKIPYCHIPWSNSTAMNEEEGGAVAIARGIYPANDQTNTVGVVSTLIYGVQWDSIIRWYKSIDKGFDLNENKRYGNN